MRTAIILASLVALVAAIPQPQAEPTVPVPASTSLNVVVTEVPSLIPSGILANATTSRTHRPHSENIPSLMKPCDCPELKTVAYPCWATDSLQVSEMEEGSEKLNGKGNQGEIKERENGEFTRGN